MQDFFSVQLQTPAGQPLPFVEHDQQRWFVGEPGQEFVLAVTRSARTSKTYVVSVRVDGQSTAVRKYLHPTGTSKSSIFQGWLTADIGPHAKTYKRFKFASCQPSRAATTVDTADEIQAGRVDVNIKEVVSTGQRKRHTPGGVERPSADVDSKKLPEGKKWFMAPGLKADAGSQVASRSGWNTIVFKEVATLPSIQVRYDSSEALYLRKALNPRFAPHRAILRKSANPAISALGLEPAHTAAAAAAAAEGVKPERVRVEHEAGVKRERQQDDEEADEEEYVPRSATAADRVDLTQEPVRPMTVNGRQLAPDELAVCDLCDSDADDAPTWQVRKKKQIEVEV